MAIVAIMMTDVMVMALAMVLEMIILVDGCLSATRVGEELSA